MTVRVSYVRIVRRDERFIVSETVHSDDGTKVFPGLNSSRYIWA